MNSIPDLPVLLEGFFIKRLMGQRQVSSHTLRAYRDTFRLLLLFTHRRLGKTPSRLSLHDLEAPLITDFLHDLEQGRGNTVRSRNLRLSAIRSFFRYAAYEAPAHAAHIQRVLAIPNKRYSRQLVHFLERAEIEALLKAPDQNTWSGRRDHLLLLVAVQTGLRVSELTALRKQDVTLGTGAHVSCMGKGRKERCTPLTKRAATLLKTWMDDPINRNTGVLFPNSRGGKLSSDGVQYLLSKHVATACKTAPSLEQKQVSPHVLRHTAAMELLQAGVDRAVIALWLGHESVETTQVYLDANLAFKEKILAKASPVEGTPGRYRADDSLLSFLKRL
ncbi:MAG: site-specific integrase [Acidobacteriota bacterium]